ncbi:putative tail assembly protein k [Escherichia coli p0305293.8]|nr:putative tail assembly protein k [Escherichia coli p0305293.11]ENG74530.1 putative tail assembly protein k [Escherichia coli p0305293.8]ENH54063.1 putative tail assembly protein k [Escherichia coli p0305293.7]
MQGEIVALVHSHPGGLPWLSEATGGCRCRVICRGGWSAGGDS